MPYTVPPTYAAGLSYAHHIFRPAFDAPPSVPVLLFAVKPSVRMTRQDPKNGKIHFPRRQDVLIPCLSLFVFQTLPQHLPCFFLKMSDGLRREKSLLDLRRKSCAFRVWHIFYIFLILYIFNIFYAFCIFCIRCIFTFPMFSVLSVFPV